jgi:hypothetical protein
VTSRPPRPTTIRQTTPPRLGSSPPRRTRLGAVQGETPPRRPGPSATPPGRTARHTPPACSRPAVARGSPAADDPHSRPGVTHPACGGPCDTRPRGPAPVLDEARLRARHTRARHPRTSHRHAPPAPGFAGPAAPAREDGGPAQARAGNPPRCEEPSRDGGAPSRVGDAATPRETPVQEGQGLLTGGGLWVLLPRHGRPTPGLSCGWKRERGTSGRWKPSAPRPCSAQGMAARSAS